MASTISAGTTSGTAIAIAGDTTGNLAFTTQAGTYTQTMPNATGTVMVSGNMPAFSAYLSASQTVTSGTWTKVAANTKEFDTASCYDNATNYRFTPNVAGYYQVNGSIAFNDSATLLTSCVIAIYKNGSNFKWGTYLTRAANNQDMDGVVSALIYFNGSTDYIELYAQASGTGTITFTTAAGGQQRDFFQAVMVRAA